MNELLQYIIENITGSKDFETVQNKSSQESENFINFEVKADPKIIGLIIGKEGRTIKAIRSLLRVRATLENVGVAISVTET